MLATASDGWLTLPRSLFMSPVFMADWLTAWLANSLASELVSLAVAPNPSGSGGGMDSVHVRYVDAVDRYIEHREYLADVLRLVSFRRYHVYRLLSCVLCMQLFSSHSHFCPCCYDYCKRYTFFADLRCCRELYLRRSLCNCSAVDCVLSSFFSRVITNIFEQFLKQIFRLILTKKREFTETSWLSLFIYAGSKLYLHITPLHMFKYYAKHQYIWS